MDLVVPGAQAALPDALERVANVVLAADEIPRPGERRWAAGDLYPIAIDANGDHAAVAFAWRNPYPDVAHGWWHRVVLFDRAGDSWHWAGGEHDNPTTPTPFDRPAAVSNGQWDWIDWHTDGGVAEWSRAPRVRRSFCGIAPRATARLIVSDGSGEERGIAIPPWCGAYTAIVLGEVWMLCGFDSAGTRLGCFGDDESRQVDESLP